MPSVPPDIARSAILLRASLSHLARQLRARSSSDGPGAAKLGVLGQLYRLGPMTPTQLARCERVRLQTLTRLLAELEAAALIRREPDEHDARKSLLSLTRAGTRVLTEDVARRETSLAGVIATQLDETERATLLSCCAIIDRLGDALAADAAGQGESLRVASRRPQVALS